MLVAHQLGGAREDLIDVLAVAVGRARAQQFVSGLEAHIKLQARVGAEQAIPQIREEVGAAASKQIKPWLIGMLIGTAVAVGAAGFAVYRTRK